MAATTASRRYSTDDLGQFPDDGRLRELVDGQVVEWGVANLRHGLVINALAYFLNAFVRPNRLGSVALADSLVRILGSRYNARGGDIAFFARGRLPQDQQASATDVVPDFVIEVLSPTDQPGAVEAKVRDWRRAGVRLLWYVEPENGVTTVYRGDTETSVGPNEALSGDDVLPGFTLRMGDVLDELTAELASGEPESEQPR
jgi:Uma2 family endonuclease